MLNDEPARRGQGAEEDAKEGRLGRRVRGREKIKNAGGNRRGDAVGVEWEFSLACRLP